jgi:hypothetical protein
LPVPQEKLFRDPIHDLIPFDRELREDQTLLRLLDSFEVQRLRRVKQLGMAHMAYHGAEHSRFAHSLGVTHLARRMADRLARGRGVDPMQLLAVHCAALLHDVGHGPFSHVMEKFFREKHEVWTNRIIADPQTEVHGILSDYSEELPGLVVKMLSGESDPPWLHTIVNSQLDVDRFDYLTRDSHMTGVKYGVFDLERLLLMLRVGEDGQRVVVANKGLLPVEKYLQSRYQMYRQVYFHKTVTSAEAMLMSVMQRARDLAQEGGLPHLGEDTPLYRLLLNGTLTIGDFLALDDSVLLNAMNLWSTCEDEILSDLSRRMLTRRLFKSTEIEAEEEEDMLFSTKMAAARELLEDHGLDLRYYLRFSKSSDTPYRPYSSRGPDSTIWIQNASDPAQLSDVKDISPTIRAFTESPYTIHRVFFPDFAGEREIRSKLVSILRN